MTKDELRAAASFGGAFVTLTDALAYGASEREAGEIAGLEAAAKATCGLCGGHYGDFNTRPIIPSEDGDTDTWHHGDWRLGWVCHAGPIHDTLARRRAEQGETK